MLNSHPLSPQITSSSACSTSSSSRWCCARPRWTASPSGWTTCAGNTSTSPPCCASSGACSRARSRRCVQHALCRGSWFRSKVCDDETEPVLRRESRDINLVQRQWWCLRMYLHNLTRDLNTADSGSPHWQRNYLFFCHARKVSSCAYSKRGES